MSMRKIIDKKKKTKKKIKNPRLKKVIQMMREVKKSLMRVKIRKKIMMMGGMIHFHQKREGANLVTGALILYLLHKTHLIDIKNTTLMMKKPSKSIKI